MAGSETTVAEHRETSPLPRALQVIVTPAVRRGDVFCFALQRRITKTLVETATLAVGSSVLYVSGVLLETDRSATGLRPRPPLLALSADDLDWSGSFTGRTRGQYVGRVIGRRTMNIGGSSVRAVGVALESNYAGEITGTQQTVQWFSLSRHLLLAERVAERRRFGLDDLRLAYSARLESLRPLS